MARPFVSVVRAPPAYAHGRSETSKDRCHLDAAMRTLGPDAMQDMVLAVVTSDAFLTREPLP